MNYIFKNNTNSSKAWYTFLYAARTAILVFNKAYHSFRKARVTTYFTTRLYAPEKWIDIT